jgi:hypothetical protein
MDAYKLRTLLDAASAPVKASSLACPQRFRLTEPREFEELVEMVRQG